MALAIAAIALWGALLATGATQVAAFTILVAAVTLRHAKEITHPLTWFGPVFWLYSAAYPLLALSGLYQYDVFLQQALGLHAIAFAAFSVPLYGRVTTLDVSHWNVHGCRLRAELAWFGTVLLLPLVAILIVRLTALGVTTKQELLSSGGQSLGMLGAALQLVTFLLTVLIAVRLRLQRSVLSIVALAFPVFATVLVYTGERDYLLRFMVVLVLLWWDFHRRPKLSTLVVFGVLLLALLPLLQALKAVALGGATNYQFEAAAIIGQEFRVSTQNTWFVLQRNVANMLPTPFAALAMDLKRALMPQVLGIDAMSTNAWFNEVVLFNVASGRGFSLVATGYLAGGAIGVAVLYHLIGWLLRALYVYRARTYLHLTVYALAAPLLMYVQRGDLSALLGPALRVLLLPSIAFMLLVEYVRRAACADSPRAGSYDRAAQAPS
jgi:hypothetical protein